MADRPHRKNPETPTPANGAETVPATPGFHEAPGRAQQNPQQSPSTIPATPGYHEAPQPTRSRTSDSGVHKRVETGAHARVQPRRGAQPAKPEWHGVTPGSAQAARPQGAPRPAGSTGPSTGQQPAQPHRPAPKSSPAPAQPKPPAAPVRPAAHAPRPAAAQSKQPAPKPAQAEAAPKVEPKPVVQAKPAAKASPKVEPKPARIKREVTEPQVPAYRPPESMVDPQRTSGPAPVAAAGVAQVDEASASHGSPAQQPEPAGQPQPVADAPEPQGPRVAHTGSRASAGAADRKRAASSKRPGIGELFSQLSDQVQALVTGEIALIKARAQGFVKKIGVGAALLIMAVVLALYMLGVLLHAAVLGLSVVLPPWAAALIVAAILLVIILILALVGIAQVKKGLNSTPNPQDDLRKDVDAVKKGITK